MADQSTPPGDLTIPSRKRMLQDVTRFGDDPAPEPALPASLPWALQLYFDGEIDLNKVLVGHFPQVPVLSTIHFGEIGRKNRLAVAALSTQDGAANMIAELDVLSLAVQFTFVQGSMLAQRFMPERLNAEDRAQWIAALRRESGEIAFLWDQSRWEHDYVVAVATKTFTNLFAFSPHHVEAAARLTPDVSHKLLDWLAKYWKM